SAAVRTAPGRWYAAGPVSSRTDTPSGRSGPRCAGDEIGHPVDGVELFEVVYGRIDGHVKCIFQEGDELEHAERVDDPAREERRVAAQIVAGPEALLQELDNRFVHVAVSSRAKVYIVASPAP